MLAFGVMALAATILGTPHASADMLMSDLQQVDLAMFPETQWSTRKEAERLTLACTACEGFVAIDVQLSGAPVGMEERIRSGQTTAATMLDICKQNATQTGAECYGIAPADLKSAVGFVSDVMVFEGTFAATYTIYQDGKLLLMRNVAGSREEAARIGKLAFESIAPQIVR